MIEIESARETVGSKESGPVRGPDQSDGDCGTPALLLKQLLEALGHVTLGLMSGSPCNIRRGQMRVVPVLRIENRGELLLRKLTVSIRKLGRLTRERTQMYRLQAE